MTSECKPRGRAAVAHMRPAAAHEAFRGPGLASSAIAIRSPLTGTHPLAALAPSGCRARSWPNAGTQSSSGQPEECQEDRARGPASATLRYVRRQRRLRHIHCCYRPTGAGTLVQTLAACLCKSSRQDFSREKHSIGGTAKRTLRVVSLPQGRCECQPATPQRRLGDLFRVLWKSVVAQRSCGTTADFTSLRGLRPLLLHQKRGEIPMPVDLAEHDLPDGDQVEEDGEGRGFGASSLPAFWPPEPKVAGSSPAGRTIPELSARYILGRHLVRVVRVHQGA